MVGALAPRGGGGTGVVRCELYIFCGYGRMGCGYGRMGLGLLALCASYYGESCRAGEL